ncbi:DCTN4 [Mytilus coruscus]|uniref:Dynactin subunit 4 n=1 Tax=Mytilus coruscus TaxID=42192 RepID=A0A6J8A7V0_MYTCO|nr:DCTN4 [Mytilus coruscus]
MATFIDVNLVKYICGCGKKKPVCKLYLCRHCLKIRCGDCVLHEVDTPYCPNCLENMPAAEAKLKRNRCSNCFDCPNCGHTLTTRATSHAVSNPEDPNKSTPKKMFYMACGFCRWTTRDVGIADKPAASGNWEDKDNPHQKRILSLLETYQQIAQKEKAEKERKKYVRRRSYLTYAAGMDKYGMVSVAAKRKGLLASPSTGGSKDEDTVISPVEPSDTVTTFEPLQDEIFTQELHLENMAGMSQRHAPPEFQPCEMTDLHPLHKHLLIRRSLRCKQCEHNLSKPEFNPISIKFKIQLIAMSHIPEIRIFTSPELNFDKECKVILTVCNPTSYNTNINLTTLEGDTQDDFSNSKITLPKDTIVVSRRDDAALYDVGSQEQEAQKDDPSVIAFRKANKVGFYVKVKPQVKEGDIQVSFMMKHDYHNTAIALTSENQEPQVVWLEQKVFVNLGPLKTQK